MGNRRNDVKKQKGEKMDREKKILNIYNTGKNICSNFFGGNADKIMTLLEKPDYENVKMTLQIEIKKVGGDHEDGVVGVQFIKPTFCLNMGSKYKVEHEDILLDFVNPDLPGMEELKSSAKIAYAQIGEKVFEVPPKDKK
jgi:hypothetical protein